jgi:hypothetical protein
LDSERLRFLFECRLRLGPEIHQQLPSRLFMAQPFPPFRTMFHWEQSQVGLQIVK